MLCVAFLTPVTALADWNGDANGDVLAVDGAGRLLMYRGNGAGAWITGQEEVIGGAGWEAYDMLLSGGDFSGDGKPDLITRSPAGQLFMYKGNGMGTFLEGGQRTLIGGAGWQSYNLLLGGFDFNGDGKPDVLARTPAGQLFMYKGNGAGAWLDGGNATLIGGAGWQAFDSLVMPGDFSGDGKADVLARTPAGQLLMYKGNGAGAWLDGGNATLIGGAGWQSYDTLVAGGDFTGDRKADLIVRSPAGQLFLYRGNGAGAWLDGGNRWLIGGGGWNSFGKLVLVGGTRLATFVPPAPAPDPFPTSTRFGGPNGIIDTPAESAAFVHTIDVTPVDDTDALWKGMSAAEQAYVEEVDDDAEESDAASAAFGVLDVDPNAGFGAADITDVDEDPNEAGGGTAEAASMPLPPDPDTTPICGREIREATSIFNTYRVKFRRKGTDEHGDAYYQYHVHFQITSAFRPYTTDYFARTHMRAYRIKPDGSFSNDLFDDSDTRRQRGPLWKPYYAHFKAMRVKPGSKLSVYAHTTFDPKPEINNVIISGVHLRRDRSACWARFS
jgi:hypothetical protein